jgi:hypothetical protein
MSIQGQANNTKKLGGWKVIEDKTEKRPIRHDRHQFHMHRETDNDSLKLSFYAREWNDGFFELELAVIFEDREYGCIRLDNTATEQEALETIVSLVETI